jgi:deoxyribose-phosphate aldolase
MTGAVQISGPKELARFLDWVCLQPEFTREDIARVCAHAREHGIGNVCVNTSRVAQACHLLEDSGVKVIAAIAYPLGAMDADAKRYETEVAVDHDAHFLEVVANVGRIKDGDHAYLLREFRDIVEAADERPVSVVIEASLLSHAEIEKICEIIASAGAKGVVTSTGFEGRDARIEDVRKVRGAVAESFGVKATGGLRDSAAALALIDAGATRIGTADPLGILKACAAQLA